MKDLFTIGEMASLFEIPIKTLRYYDDIELLVPESKNKKTGYRYYSTRQFEQLNTIMYLRALQIPLKDISRFLHGKDTDTMIDILKAQQEEINLQMENLKNIQQKISSRLSQIEDAKASQLGNIQLAAFKERPVIFLRKEIPVTDDLEYPIRQLEQEGHFQSNVFLGKIGVSIDKEHILTKNFSKFSGIFIMAEHDEAHKTNGRLKSGYYLTLRFAGTHTKASTHYRRLLHYIESHELAITGDSVEITLIDAGMTDDTSQFVTEIQIPVKKINI